MKARIVFNGKEYASPDEMPPQVRQAYEQMLQTFADRNQDGVPDFLQQGATPGQFDLSFNTIEYNGQTYKSLAEMPPEVREAYEKAMQALSGAGLGGLADVLREGAGLSAQPSAPLPVSAARPPKAAGTGRPYAPAAGSQPVLSGDVESSTRNLRWLLIGGAAVILLLLAVIAGLVALYVIPNLP